MHIIKSRRTKNSLSHHSEEVLDWSRRTGLPPQEIMRRARERAEEQVRAAEYFRARDRENVNLVGVVLIMLVLVMLPFSSLMFARIGDHEGDLVPSQPNMSCVGLADAGGCSSSPTTP